MIEPFEDEQIKDSSISYGVSSYGYDMRVAREFRIFTNVNSAIVDPKEFDENSFVEYEGDICIVPPNSFGAGPIGRIFQDSEECSDDLRGQEYVRSMRNYHQRDAV